MLAPLLPRPLGRRPAGAPTLRRFVRRVSDILGSDVRVFWTPGFGDTTTSTSLDPLAKTITWDDDVSARRSNLGRGQGQTFTAASSQFGTIADAESLSFGNGLVDGPITIIVLANITDTAAARRLLSKYDNATPLREYLFGLSASDTLAFVVYDESVDQQPSIASTAPIQQGAWQIFGVTYTAATGGATAANDMTLFQGGVALAASRANAASYVAMENTAAQVEIGALSTALQYMEGSMALAIVARSAATADQHAQIAGLCRNFFGVTLDPQLPTLWGATARWSLDNDAGSPSLADSVGSNTLTNNNAATLTTAKLGSGAAQLVGASTQSFSVADNAALSTGDVDFAISAWVKLDSVGADRVIAAKRANSTTSEWVLRYGTSSERFQILLHDSGGSQIGAATATNFGALSLGVWYHVFGWHDAANNSCGIAVNGVTNTASTTGAPSDTSGVFRIGAMNATAANPWDGAIDEVAFFKSPPGGIAAPIAEGMIARIYNGGAGRFYPWH